MLGYDLCHELKADYVVEGTDIAAPEGLPVKFYHSDITDPENISRVIDAARPNFVIHAAAWTDVDGCESDKAKALLVNAEGAKNVAAACGRYGAAMVYISTDFVFDGRKAMPYKESDKTSPLSVYGLSKLEGEKGVRKTLKKHFIIRTSWLYGLKGKNFVDTIVAKSMVEKTLKVVDDQTGSPTYTKDLAEAVHSLLDKVSQSKPVLYGTYHVSNAGKVSWFDYAKEVVRLAGGKARVLPMTSAELGRPARRPAMSVLDGSKFSRYTGHRMRGWKAALKDYVINEKGLKGRR